MCKRGCGTKTGGQPRYQVPRICTMQATTRPKKTAVPPMRGMGLVLMRRLEG